MSAVETYRKFNLVVRFSHDLTQQDIDVVVEFCTQLQAKADAAIAELEAELDELKQQNAYYKVQFEFDPSNDTRLVDAVARAEKDEAELKEAIALLAEGGPLFDEMTAIARKAEAALDDLKARRCWNCRAHRDLAHGGHVYGHDTSCPMYGTPFDADFVCRRWAAKP